MLHSECFDLWRAQECSMEMDLTTYKRGSDSTLQKNLIFLIRFNTYALKNNEAFSTLVID